jgi:hypothetical protein
VNLKHLLMATAASQDNTPGAGGLAGKFVGGKGSVTLGYGAGPACWLEGATETSPFSRSRWRAARGWALPAVSPI